MGQKTMEKNDFLAFLKAVKAPAHLDADFLYSVLTDMMDGVGELAENYPAVLRSNVNQIQLALYLVNEHAFYLDTHKDKSQEELVKEDNYAEFLVSVSFAKYFSNEQIPFNTGSFASRYSPALSSLNLYLNFILRSISVYRTKDPYQVLLVSIMNKGFQIAKCISTLLEQGYETEAFSAWRSLHENESILAVIVKYGEEVGKAYMRHARYGVAYRGGIPSKEETDKVFEEIKAGMREKGLKSKDMKRYIEYGWLYSVPNVENVENFKINFRDGVERIAGLSQYSKVYERSSEIAHSSPLLIFSRKDEYFALTLINLYETFFRLEKIFTTVFILSLPESSQQGYARIKRLYYWEVQAVYALIRARAEALAKNNRKAPEQESDNATED